MEKEIKMGMRPVIAFGVMALVFATFIVVVGATKGDVLQSLKIALAIVFLFGGILISVAGNSLIVTDNGITLKSWFVIEKKINFSDFDLAVPRVLAEPDHPVMLALLKSDGGVVAEIRLKPYPKKDVQWLLSLDEMKIAGTSG